MLANSAVYKSCQQKLLTAEIEEKKGVINEHKKIKIKQQVNPIDFAHISLIFLICNDKNHYQYLTATYQYLVYAYIVKATFNQSSPIFKQ